MALSRTVFRSSRLLVSSRPFGTIAPRFALKDGVHENVDEHRKHQTERELNPHMTNTNSTIANDIPSVGTDKAPPVRHSTVRREQADLYLGNDILCRSQLRTQGCYS